MRSTGTYPEIIILFAEKVPSPFCGQRYSWKSFPGVLTLSLSPPPLYDQRMQRMSKLYHDCCVNEGTQYTYQYSYLGLFPHNDTRNGQSQGCSRRFVAPCRHIPWSLSYTHPRLYRSLAPPTPSYRRTPPRNHRMFLYYLCYMYTFGNTALRMWSPRRLLFLKERTIKIPVSSSIKFIWEKYT